MFKKSEGSLLSEFGSRLSDALIRHRADQEVQAARKQAEVSIRARSEFLANMNHELRTPLNAVIGFATMLREAKEYNLSEEQQREYIDIILQSADLLLGHINIILEVSALESGRLEVHDDDFDMGDALAEAMKRSEIRATATGVRLERRDLENNAWAFGDRDRTSQAIDHLLQTAIKSCKSNGRVLARATMNADGRAEVAVRDNGEGFTAEELERALAAFKEVNGGLDRCFAGPGVGYAVAKSFVEMQGGEFEIESRKGKGTLARIILPAAAAKSDSANSEHPREMSVEIKDDAA